MRPSDFTACMVSDDMRTVGSFKTSDELLNRIYPQCLVGHCGQQGMPVDLTRSATKTIPFWATLRGSALGGRVVFDNAKLYRKLLDDLKRAQKSGRFAAGPGARLRRYFSDNMTWPESCADHSGHFIPRRGDLSAVSDLTMP